MEERIAKLQKQRGEIEYELWKLEHKSRTAKKRERAPKEAAPKANEPVAPFECNGNLITGEKCANADQNKERAQDTKKDGKFHPTCKQCKNAMKRMKTQKKKEAK